MIYKLLLVEDNPKLRPALQAGLENTGRVKVIFSTGSGEAALAYCLESAGIGEGPVSTLDETIQEPDPSRLPDALLMDVQLEGDMNGIQAAVEIRREFPRMPVVFYSIQDDDAYYRDFRRSGILSHYAYVRKSNYLLAEMILPLVSDAVAGRSFIDPDIEIRVQEVRQLDEQSPLALLEPNEQVVAKMLAQGMTNEQIAARLGFRDKRTVSRTNGQIYTAWALNTSTTDEKIARTRAAIIMQLGRLVIWDDDGIPRVMDARGDWVPLEEG